LVIDNIQVAYEMQSELSKCNLWNRHDKKYFIIL